MERNRRGELRKKEKCNELTRKYKIREKGEAVILEELKQRLQAKAAKLKRYERRIEQYRLNGLFQQDQKRVYQELNGEMKTEGTVPDADESEHFWSGIWGCRTRTECRVVERAARGKVGDNARQYYDNN